MTEIWTFGLSNDISRQALIINHPEVLLVQKLQFRYNYRFNFIFRANERQPSRGYQNLAPSLDILFENIIDE